MVMRMRITPPAFPCSRRHVFARSDHSNALQKLEGKVVLSPVNKLMSKATQGSLVLFVVPRLGALVQLLDRHAKHGGKIGNDVRVRSVLPRFPTPNAPAVRLVSALSQTKSDVVLRHLATVTSLVDPLRVDAGGSHSARV